MIRAADDFSLIRARLAEIRQSEGRSIEPLPAGPDQPEPKSLAEAMAQAMVVRVADRFCG